MPFDPVRVDPFPPPAADEYPIQPCFLDEQEKVPAPDIFAYPGVPANASAPYWGSYDSIHVAGDRCYERFGRFGPYGYSYGREAGGLGLAEGSERVGAERVLARFPTVDYRNVSWGEAQKRCFAKNKHRFDAATPPPAGGGTAAGTPAPPKPRTAFVLRTYTGYQYTDLQLLSLRATINELALQSGGEYDVHLLLHVKDESIPIHASDAVYRATIEANVPREFWDMTTLWSEALMRLYYPGPFPGERNFENPSNQPLHGVYRSAHLALQWFAQQHPEYEHFWNWEMDVRYAGHHYEFHEGVARWAQQQPRKLLWERSSRFWIPSLHGSWAEFAARVERETAAEAATTPPVWGPVEFARGSEGALPALNGTAPPTSFAADDYAWGVGEAADLIVFDPLFDPARTNWVFRLDADGYDTALPPPPRRTAIITIARLSRRLLDRMHEETYRLRHSMFPEMWPPSVALHAGLKAAYAPHPVVFDHRWPPEVMDQVFNRPARPEESPFGWGEHNMRGGSFYYDSGFSSVLWRRWLGGHVDGQGGGRAFEESHSGRMCMRPLLHHPIKSDA